MEKMSKCSTMFANQKALTKTRYWFTPRNIQQVVADHSATAIDPFQPY